jgi:ZIP family zinc transporter
VSGLLPFSFAFAAGAMLALVVIEILPRAYSGAARPGPSLGFAAGAAVMLALGIALGV